KHEIIGDVRGRGLFIGVELMRDLESLTPATEEANSVVNQMKDLGILISSDGPDHNVLKIKPPIIFTCENADTLVVNLATIINKLSKD
ncbi:MAG: aminotransferase class III-fold pyridoxal phosphate-dependent enzyme, partial [Candidatus Marinimicrobia bacterium]|nr:aminotransferase class III-fold pyridoxal phosphate-dependent enzyme [Candidatus Neomarinimicrobiota bacterium]